MKSTEIQSGQGKPDSAGGKQPSAVATFSGDVIRGLGVAALVAACLTGKGILDSIRERQDK